MPRTWLIMLFGYSGKQYYGMQYQRQENIRSIQKQIITILYGHGFLQTDDYVSLGKTYKWGRAARTDKGVHAIMNAISCLFCIPQKFYDQTKILKKKQLLQSIHDLLIDSNIYVHSIKRVVTRFDTRQMVKARTYNYICPKYYFSKQNKDDMEQNLVQRINQCCKKFIGTHNFHNYSKNIKAKDPQAQRYVIQFKCEQLQTQLNSIKWIRFTIKGQSFIYHQIRKIIGCIIFVMLNKYQANFIENTFYKNQMPIPLAPPFGLYLYQLYFDSYNRKKQIPEKIQLNQVQVESAQKLQKQIIKQIAQIDEKQWKTWYESTVKGIQQLNFEDQQKDQGQMDDN